MGHWNVDQVGEWLRVIGFEQQIKTFKDRNIDGRALTQLTNYDVLQILIVLNEDETIKKPTFAAMHRFREALSEWKTLSGQTKKRNTTKIYILSKIVKQQENSSKLSLVDVPSKNQLFVVDNDNHQYKYLINDHIHVQFFKNPKFGQYLINYIQEQTFQIRIEIQQVSPTDEQSSYSYSIQFSGEQQQANSVCNVIERLFGTVKSKAYNQNKVKTWLHNPRAVGIIQAIMDNENDLFTVCHASNKYNEVLEIYYFHEKSFNLFENTVRIDQIIHNNILRVVFVLHLKKTNRCISKIGNNTKNKISQEENKQTTGTRTKKSSKYDNKKIEESKVNTAFKRQNKQAIRFQEELIETIKHHNQENGLISLTLRKMMTDRKKPHIEIFGYFKLVNEIVQKIQDIVNKYCLTKYQLSEMTSMEMNYLVNVCRPELKAIEKEFQNDNVQFRIRQHAFYASSQLKDEIESRIKTLLSQLTTSTFKTTELYYDIANRANLIFETIARNNHCHYDFKIETTLKPCTIPRAVKTSLSSYSVSKLTIEQSTSFCSSPMVHRQATLANGSLEVLIGDIAAQKVDTIIIPSVSYGLKESLLERAGEIVQKQSEKSGKNSIPYITGTTAGRLPCKNILFVNWSLSTMAVVDNETRLRESVRTFISKVIQYVVMEHQQSNMETQSIAFAVPDSCSDEKSLAEEMIYETQRQIQSIKSTSLKVLFILLPDQETLHEEFLTAISTMQTNDNTYGVLFYPTSTITITLTSSKQEYLAKCQEKISNYFSRCMVEVELDGFNDWNQDLINAYYKYCNDRYVLPQIGNDQRIVLKGSITAVNEAKQKYQLTVGIVKAKMHLQQSLIKIPRSMSAVGSLTTETSTCYNVMISYCQKDSVLSLHLANRLMDEGFFVCLSSNGVSDHNDNTLSQMNKSDCIILCISENYFEDEHCEKEAKYASQINKKIIPVKIQNCTLVDWLRQLLVDQLTFQMFGSEKQFDLVFDQLLLEILQCKSPSDVFLLQQASSRTITSAQNDTTIYHPNTTKLSTPLKTLEQRKLTDEINVENLEKGKFTEDENKIVIEKVEDIIHETEDRCEEHMRNYENGQYPQNIYNPEYERRKNKMKQQIWLDKGVLSYRHRLKQVSTLRTKQNIAPFTVSGDINDAPFPMLNMVLQNPNLFLRSYTKQSSPWTTIPSKMNVSNIRYSGPSHQSYYYGYGGSMDNYSNNNYRAIRYIPWGMATEKEIRHRQEMIDSSNMIKRRKEIGKYFMKNYIYVTEEKLKLHLEFAQRMKDNANELTRLCEMNPSTLQEQSKQKTQASVTAIFSLCTEPQSKEPPITTSKIEIPSKFPRESNLKSNKYSILRDRVIVIHIFF